MFGFTITYVDWAALAIAVIITIYVNIANNPHGGCTNEYKTLCVCRIGLAFLAWSFVFGSGLIGFAFALTAFISGIIGIVKGRTVYGAMLIIGFMVIPLTSILNIK